MTPHPTIVEPPNAPPTVDDVLTGLDAARAFLQRLPWPIYLAHVHSKKPLWQGFKQSATTDLAELDRRWKRFPHANPMALIQPPYVVLDVDPRNGGLLSLEALMHQYGPLPPTWCDHTRDGGYHAFFRYAEGGMLPPLQIKPAPGVELLGPRHPLTIPGFQHADGHINTWDEFLHPGTMPCAELPPWMLRLLQTPMPQPQNPSPFSESLARADQGNINSVEGEGPGNPPPPKTEGKGGGQDSLPQLPLILERLTAVQVADLLRDPQIVPTVLAYLARVHGRLTPVLGKNVLAWFREEEHASAAFMPPKAKHLNVLYYDRGLSEKGQTLPAVLFRIVNGKWPGTMRPSTFLMWGARLLVESGAVKAASTNFPALPEDAPPVFVPVYRGMEVLTRARSILVRPPGEDPDDMPYAEDFCKHWIGTSYRIAHDGLMWLVSRGYFWFRRWRKKLALFVRGTKRLIARLRHAPIATNQKAAVRANELAQKAVALEAAPLRRPGQVQACPLADVRSSHFDKRHCEHCAQAYLEEKRRLFVRSTFVELPNIDWEPLYDP